MMARRGTLLSLIVATTGALTLGAVLSACGSGTPEAKTSNGSADVSGDNDYGGGDTAQDSYCLDGTCFDCGPSFCMPGWYCDESMDGGPGCAFVPECGAQSSCGCVESTLDSACACVERDGGVYVTCK